MKSDERSSKITATLVTVTAATVLPVAGHQAGTGFSQAEPADETLHHELDAGRPYLPGAGRENQPLKRTGKNKTAADKNGVAEERESERFQAASALLSTLPEFQPGQDENQPAPVQTGTEAIQEDILTMEENRTAAPMEPSVPAVKEEEPVVQASRQEMIVPLAEFSGVTEDRLEKMPVILQPDLETMPSIEVTETEVSEEDPALSLPEDEPVLEDESVLEESQAWEELPDGEPFFEEEPAGQTHDVYADLNQRIVDAALSLVDTTNGMQCTEVVAIALNEAGIQADIDWPDTYLAYGTTVENPVAGNLIYYDNGGRGTDHIAIYIGEGQAVHGNFTRSAEEGPVTTVYDVFYQEGLSPVYIQVEE